MRRPRLLDLFCGAGGCAWGYANAGFDVVGVDIDEQLSYPFPMFRADAIDFPLDGFDMVHASPPCHDHSATSRFAGKDGTGWMLEHTISRLKESGIPWVVENVVGAPMQVSLTLCGTMFDLTAWEGETPIYLNRHRIFASSHPLMSPGPCQCDAYKAKGYTPAGLHGHSPLRGESFSPKVATRRRLMEVPWMNRDEIAQAIPPAYCEWIGVQMLRVVNGA